jgi:hypothetical protein
LDPDNIDVLDFMQVDPDGAPLTGLAPVGGNLAFFTGRSTYLLVGSSDVDFYLSKVADVGCLSHHSIVDCAGNLIFLGDDGVYAYQGSGGTPQRISQKIDPLLAKIATPETSVGAFYDNRYFLFYNGSGGQYPYNDSCLVFDLKTNSWTSYEGVYADCAFVRTVELDRPEFLIGTAAPLGYVYKFLEGNDDDGTEIVGALETGDMPLRGGMTESRIRKVMVHGQTGTDLQSVIVSYASDRETDMTGVEMSLASASANKWGVGQWGVAHWQRPTLAKKTFVPAAPASNYFRLRFATSDTQTDPEKRRGVELYGYSILERDRRVRT